MKFKNNFQFKKIGLYVVLAMWFLPDSTIAQSSCATQAIIDDEIKITRSLNSNTIAYFDDDCEVNGKIPVVFHKVERINPSCSSCLDIASTFSQADANEVIAQLNKSFKNIATDLFKIAKLDKNQNTTSGLTTLRDVYTDAGLSIDRSEQLEKFPGDLYLNIFITNRINKPGNSGVAFFPEKELLVANESGVVMEAASIMKPNNTTITHEVGHWLGLRHIWGKGNSPAQPGNCCSDDSDEITKAYIQDLPNFKFCSCMKSWADDEVVTTLDSDTPNTIGHSGLASQTSYEGSCCAETCSDDCDDQFVVPAQTNFMDYTPNNNSFSEWQECVMRSVLLNPVEHGGRLQVLQNSAALGDKGCEDVVAEENTFFEYLPEQSNNFNCDAFANSIIINFGEIIDENQIVFRVLAGSPIRTRNLTSSYLGNNQFQIDLQDMDGITENFSFTLRVIIRSVNRASHCKNFYDLNFKVEIEDETDCQILYKSFLHTTVGNDNCVPFFDELRTNGPDYSYISSSFLGDFIDLTIETDGSDFNMNLGQASLTLFMSNVQEGEDIGPDTDWQQLINSSNRFDLNKTAGEIEYVAFKLQATCGLEYYGWLRYLSPKECSEDAMRILDMAIQTEYGTSIHAGETKCSEENSGCDCHPTIVPTATTFLESPSTQGNFSDIEFHLEGCDSAVFEGAPTVSPANKVSVQKDGDKKYIIQIRDATDLEEVTVDFPFSDCTEGKQSYTLDLFKYPTEMSCPPTVLHQTVNSSGPTAINGNLVTPFGTLNPYLYLFRDGNQFRIYENSDADIVLLSTPNEIKIGETEDDATVFINDVTILAKGKYRLPFYFDFGCDDKRLAYITYQIDCFGNLYLHEFNLAPNPYVDFNALLACDSASSRSASLPSDEWPVLTANDFDVDLDGVLQPGYVCFTLAPYLSQLCGATFEVELESVDGTFSTILTSDPLTVMACLPSSELYFCSDYVYKIRYSCSSYTNYSPWSLEKTFKTSCDKPTCENSGLVVTILGQNVECGNATLTAVGDNGYPPYSYEWSSSTIMNPISVSSSGTYTVTVTDANACTNVASHTVTIVDPPLVSSINPPLELIGGSSLDLVPYFAGSTLGGNYYNQTCPSTTTCPSVAISSTYNITSSGLETFAYCVDGQLVCDNACDDFDIVVSNCDLSNVSLYGFSGDPCENNTTFCFQYQLPCNLPSPFGFTQTSATNNLGLSPQYYINNNNWANICFNSDAMQAHQNEDLVLTTDLVLDYAGAIGTINHTIVDTYSIPSCSECDCNVELVDNGDCTLTVSYFGTNCHNYGLEVEKYRDPGCGGNDCLLYHDYNLFTNGDEILIDDLQNGSCSSYDDDTQYRATLYANAGTGCEDVEDACVDVSGLFELTGTTYSVFNYYDCSNDYVKGIIQWDLYGTNPSCCTLTGTYKMDIEVFLNGNSDRAFTLTKNVINGYITGNTQVGYQCGDLQINDVLSYEITFYDFNVGGCDDTLPSSITIQSEHDWTVLSHQLTCCSGTQPANNRFDDEKQSVDTHDFSVNEFTFNLFPNPAKDQINIHFDTESVSYDLKLVTITGQEILRVNEITRQNFILYLQDIPSGLYLVQLTYDGKEEIQKLIVE